MNDREPDRERDKGDGHENGEEREGRFVDPHLADHSRDRRYAGHPMPKRSRVRARARRPIQTAPERVEPEERPDRNERERAERRPRYRGAPLPPGGSHAIGEASPTLERAAALERGYVVKDFGRLSKVVVGVLVLLVASGFAVSALVK